MKKGKGGNLESMCYNDYARANVAQLVEQLTRNEQVSGSSPLVGSIFNKGKNVSSNNYSNLRIKPQA